MPSELTRIADQLSRAVHGRAWHGPAILEILKNVDAASAAAHPIPAAHSAWELLLHITAWTRAVTGRLHGKPMQLRGAKNWPPVSDISSAAWAAALDDFRAAQIDLLHTLDKMRDKDLARQVPGKKYNNWFLLHGLVQHHLYHAGQMALLKKAAH